MEQSIILAPPAELVTEGDVHAEILTDGVEEAKERDTHAVELPDEVGWVREGEVMALLEEVL